MKHTSALALLLYRTCFYYCSVQNGQREADATVLVHHETNRIDSSDNAWDAGFKNILLATLSGMRPFARSAL